MGDDDILREIREYRDAYSARFHYDVDAIFRDLQERSRTSGRRVVSFARDGTERVIVDAPAGTTEAPEAGRGQPAEPRR